MLPDANGAPTVENITEQIATLQISAQTYHPPEPIAALQMLAPKAQTTNKDVNELKTTKKAVDELLEIWDLFRNLGMSRTPNFAVKGILTVDGAPGSFKVVDAVKQMILSWIPAKQVIEEMIALRIAPFITAQSQEIEPQDIPEISRIINNLYREIDVYSNYLEWQIAYPDGSPEKTYFVQHNINELRQMGLHDKSKKQDNDKLTNLRKKQDQNRNKENHPNKTKAIQKKQHRS